MSRKPQNFSLEAPLNRRRFISRGLAGNILLFFTPLAVLSCESDKTSPFHMGSGYAFRFLSSSDVFFLAAIIPVILESAAKDSFADGWPDEKILEVIGGVDTAVLALSGPTRDDLKKLLTLLSFGPIRFYLTGTFKPWQTLDQPTLESALSTWSTSRFLLMRSAFDGLKKLILASWYANPASWSFTGYPGPPKI